MAIPSGGDSEPSGIGGGPGARALREILRRRQRRHSDRRSSSSAGEQLPDNAKDILEKRRQQRQQQQTAIATISWPEFVDAFIPLGQWEWDDAVDAELQQENLTGSRAAANQEQGRREAGEEQAGEGGIVGGDEVQLLRVAFAATAVGSSRSGGEAGVGPVVSLAELRAASALLDGEEPPEEPVRKALGVNAQDCVVSRVLCCLDKSGGTDLGNIEELVLSWLFEPRERSLFGGQKTTSP